ncbi:MAG TPA: YbhB/YbcL family Raf kinase inhibitor-like protein [Aliidongia sp.]|nr:YbhB/YbcL family Raf kinase inhibitor-like protein [Aliidongia sp.]
MRKQFCAIAAVLGVTCGASLYAQSPAFAVDFTWRGTTSCFDPKSPPFSLTGVPNGTKALKFSMKDLDAPTYPHGGGSIPYAGQNQIARGAFSYQGPCPPEGQHSYQWIVEARDESGRTLATATVTKKFPER